MGDNRANHAQWTLDLTIYRSGHFGHHISAQVLETRGGWKPVGNWRWQGRRIPAEVIEDCTARVAAVIAEHLWTRYSPPESV